MIVRVIIFDLKGRVHAKDQFVLFTLQHYTNLYDFVLFRTLKYIMTIHTGPNCNMDEKTKSITE